MKKSSIVLTVIFVVFFISGANCNENGKCLSLNQECSNGDDCCSKICRRSINIFYKYCKEPNIIVKAMQSLHLTGEEGKCAYFANKDGQLSNKLYNTFGVNAGHATLLPGTIVEVTYNDAKILVTINDHPINRTDIILDLNTEAAEDLGIMEKAVVPCKVRVPFLENHAFMKDIFYYIPFVSVIVGSYLLAVFIVL